MNKNLQRWMIIAMLTAIAVVVGWLESFVPVFIPGVRLGLANVVILIMIYEFKFYEGLIADIIRILVVALLRGTLLQPVFLMSLAGGMTSFFVMLGFSKIKVFTAVGTSVMGSIFHSLAQMIVAYLIISSVAVYYYLPFVILLSLGTGIISGFICDIYLSRSITSLYADVRKYPHKKEEIVIEEIENNN